jgi:hypothetical protein
MTKRTDIAVAICSVFAVAVYFYGVYAWKDTLHQPEHVVEAGKRVYFLSFESAFYAGTLVGVMMAERFWAKVFTRGLNSVCAVILYEEIRNGDKQWEAWTYGLPAVILINFFVLYSIIDKIKQHGR